MNTFMKILPYFILILLFCVIRIIIVPKENRKIGRGALVLLLFAAIIVGSSILLIILMNIAPQCGIEIPDWAAVSMNFITAMIAGQVLKRHITRNHKGDSINDDRREG